MVGISSFDITNEDGKIEYKKAADYIAEQFFIRIPSDTKEIMVYNKDKGIYEEGKHLVHNELIRVGGKKANSHALKEVLHFLKGSPQLQYDVKKHDTRHIVTLTNGHYNIKENFFFEHNWCHYATTQLPVKYDENADCPRIKKFIGEVVGEENVEIVREAIGYCLYRDYPIHKAFMFVGAGQNGKSVLINLFKTFLGEENYTSLKLQAIAHNRFATAALYNKMANICGDLDKAALKSTGSFKMLTGNDSIDVEQKFGGHRSMKSFAKMIFSANELPKTEDMTFAFFRRWIILTFPYTFAGEKCDKDLLKKLTTDEELSGLFNWCIGGLRNLLKNGEFTSTKSTEETEKEYLRRSSSADAFVKECLDYNAKACMSKDDVYEVYGVWCSEHRLSIEDKKELTSGIQKRIYQARESSRRRPNGEKGRIRCWTGIGFKEGSLDNIDLESIISSFEEDIEIDKSDIDDIQTNLDYTEYEV